MTRRSFLAIAAAAAPLRAGQPPAFPHWNAEHVDRLLTDSPWAQPLSVSFEYQPNPASPPVRSEIYLTVRWASALPIRQALALAEFGRDGLHQPAARQLLDRNDDALVVEIAGFPSLMSGGAAQLERRLARSAALTVKGRRAVRAAEVRVPEHGTHLLATLRFPRFENLSPEEGAIRFYAEAGPVRIEREFKLKAMTYEGRLEL